MQLSRENLLKRYEQGEKEFRSGRTLLVAARLVVGLTLVLIAYNLWRGWRGTDYYYVFLLVVWTGLLIVQTKIQRHKRTELERLEHELSRS